MPVLDDSLDSSFLDGLLGVAFDCDGVLFDSWEANKAYYNTILAGLGLGVMDAGMEAFVHAHAVKDSILRITPEGREEEAFAIARGIDYTTLLHHMIPEPGLEDMLNGLQDAGLRLGVFTNRTNTMETILDLFHLGSYFNPVMTAGKVPPKPSPDGLHRILDAWSASPRQVAFVGDSHLDQEAAEAAGLRFWAYKAPQLEADLHLPDFPSLLRQVQKHYRTVR